MDCRLANHLRVGKIRLVSCRHVETLVCAKDGDGIHVIDGEGLESLAGGFGFAHVSSG